MKRAEIHAAIDKWLDDSGYKDHINIPYGSLAFQINFVEGREEIRIRERETVKTTKR